MPNSNVTVVGGVQKYNLPSDGTTSWSYVDLDLSQIEAWGPHLKQIAAHTDTRNRSSNHQWKVVLYTSFDGRQWEGPADLFSAVSADGYVTQTAFTDTTKLGLKLKLALAVANTSGTNTERANISVAFAFMFST